MKLFTCTKCQNILNFENTICLKCASTIGFSPETLSMITLQPLGDNVFADIKNKKSTWHLCENAGYQACNWLIPAGSPEKLCLACDLNRTIPFLNKPANLVQWKLIEAAKRRLIYSLMRLHLPIRKKEENEEAGLIFEFLEDNDPERKVITQHDDGRIELNINEADEAQRVKNKIDLGEQYRTLLGHFRHEIGHYYWDVFYKHNEKAAEKFRKVFGDERADYDDSLKKYYASETPPGWNDHFISQYATSHPWEDWAETWAHYLHLMDTLETAYSFGIVIDPPEAGKKHELKAKINRDPYTIKSFEDIIALWIPLTFSVNGLNRSMGHPEFYPFVIAGPVTEKLKFIHKQIKAYEE